jgi:hypothetical protein
MFFNESMYDQPLRSGVASVAAHRFRFPSIQTARASTLTVPISSPPGLGRHAGRQSSTKWGNQSESAGI